MERQKAAGQEIFAYCGFGFVGERIAATETQLEGGGGGMNVIFFSSLHFWLGVSLCVCPFNLLFFDCAKKWGQREMQKKQKKQKMGFGFEAK
jgi:hypothetical protein